MNVHKKIVAVTALCMSLFMGACGGAKLSTANEQMERGEYFDASKTYRKIYNKLTKREERELRGEVAFKMPSATGALTNMPAPQLHIRMPSAMAMAIRRFIYRSQRCSMPKASMPQR